MRYYAKMCMAFVIFFFALTFFSSVFRKIKLFAQIVFVSIYITLGVAFVDRTSSTYTHTTMYSWQFILVHWWKPFNERKKKTDIIHRQRTVVWIFLFKILKETRFSIRFLLESTVHLYFHWVHTVLHAHTHTQMFNKIEKKKTDWENYLSALRIRDAMCSCLFLYQNSRNLCSKKESQQTQTVEFAKRRARIYAHTNLNRRSTKFFFIYISRCTYNPECLCLSFLSPRLVFSILFYAVWPHFLL